MSLLTRIGTTNGVPEPSGSPASTRDQAEKSLPKAARTKAATDAAAPSSPAGSTRTLGQIAQKSSPTESRTLAKLKREEHKDPFASVKGKVQTLLAEETNRDRTLTSPEAIRRNIEQLLDTVLLSENIQATRADRARLLEAIAADALGFGPIQSLLDDETVTEIMVNGPDQVYVERDGKLSMTDIRFDEADHVMRVIDRIVSPLGRRIDESSPYVDARLPDGSRVNAIIPPISLIGPVVTVRKFSATPLTVEDLVRSGAMTNDMAAFLEACVRARLNMIVSGGTGSGKTTLLNVLSGFIPESDRIVTIEDAAELQLRQDHIVALEARPPNIEGKGQVTIRDLVSNALRMRPDRIVVGEVRRGEALDMLAAMNTGHDGSLTTIHANSPRDVLSRLETMVLMAGMDLPLKAVRDQIAKAVDLVVHVSRMADGSRRIVNVSEIQGMEGDVITMQDIFEFHQTGVQLGRVLGELRPSGIRPKFVDRFGSMGITLPPTVFGEHYIPMV